MITLHICNSCEKHFTIEFEGKIKITEPKELKGVDKEGKSKSMTFEVDTYTATKCKEIHISFNKFGSLVYNSIVKQTERGAVW